MIRVKGAPVPTQEEGTRKTRWNRARRQGAAEARVPAREEERWALVHTSLCAWRTRVLAHVAVRQRPQLQ